MDYNLQADRPRTEEDTTQPKPVVAYQNNMGFDVKKADNVIYGTTTVELQSNKYPKWFSRLFHLRNKKTLTPITKEYLLAFEDTGLLLMGMEHTQNTDRKGVARVGYFFDKRNVFLPKKDITKATFDDKKRGSVLHVEGRLNLTFQIPSTWQNCYYHEANYRYRHDLIKRLKD